MNETMVLTPERILEVTEDVLRRFGLAKATVVDVARALDVSHGSVYRHFPSKASLRDAVAKRWLERVNAPLEKIAESSGPAPARLERWLRALFAAKYKRVCEDPEMFATYRTYFVRWRQAGRVPCHRRQNFGARDLRCHYSLPSSRSFRGMERPGAGRAGRRLADAPAPGPGSAAQALRRSDALHRLGRDASLSMV
jgi:AcrR family transcriptional regulator